MDSLWKSRLEKAISDKGEKFKPLSIRAGLNETFLRDLFKKNKEPSVDNLAKLCDALRIPVSYILDGVDPQSALARKVPEIDYVAASELAETTDPYRSDDPDAPYIEVAGLPHDNFIALKVQGDSMNRVAPEGSKIIVDLNDRELVNRRLYVFRDGSSATFKMYRSDPVRLEPQSFGEHEIIFPQGALEPVGRVKLVIHEV